MHAEIQKQLFGTVCLTPRKRSGPPLRAFADASRRRGVGGTSCKLVRFVPLRSLANCSFLAVIFHPFVSDQRALA
jgi:hypothetical protein